jgi:hypothetical protein
MQNIDLPMQMKGEDWTLTEENNFLKQELMKLQNELVQMNTPKRTTCHFDAFLE